MIRRSLKKIVQRIKYSEKFPEQYSRALEEISNIRNTKELLQSCPSTVSVIIFSKDRAIQLHALLSSFFELVEGHIEIFILYTASDKNHSASYEQVFSIFKGKSIQFKEEKNFRTDLLELLNNISTNKLFFLVDDIVFTEPFIISDFINYNTDMFVPTLRLGGNLSYSYTTQEHQPLPVFLDDVVKVPNKLIWIWENGLFDWGYPLSVDGNLFDTNEIRILIKHSDFKAPNSLEESLQVFNSIYKTRYGLAFKKSVIVNIPCNKVQVENDNIAGSISTGTLLKKWQEGYQIDYRNIFHFKNTSAHQEINFKFIKRDPEFVW